MRMTIVVFIAAIVFAGCTGYGNYMLTNEKLPATNAKDIKVYAMTEPGSKYEVLGYLSVYYSDAQDDGNNLKEKLKMRAAQIGANAIIELKLTEAVSGGGGAEGIAIRFK